MSDIIRYVPVQNGKNWIIMDTHDSTRARGDDGEPMPILETAAAAVSRATYLNLKAVQDNAIVIAQRDTAMAWREMLGAHGVWYAAQIVAAIRKDPALKAKRKANRELKPKRSPIAWLIRNPLKWK